MENLKQSIEKNMNHKGGGLAVNVTGKYESNRHAIAKMEKVTFGDAASFLSKKKNGGLKITAKELLSAYFKIKGEPEWHHAGFLPKSYGGGMKKTYFLDDYYKLNEAVKLLKQASKIRVKKIKESYFENILIKKQREFLNENANHFSRITKTPEICIITNIEMFGKYGFFESNDRYNLPQYFTGYSFENEDKKNEYLKIK